MSLRLRIEHGQDAGKTWRLPRAGVYTLGRANDASMRILDMKVSKMHCEIQLTAQGAVLKDLKSTHGCMVNAQPVNGMKRLNPGDEVRLGMTILRVLSDGEADEDAEPAAGREASADAGPAARSRAPATKQTLAADDLVGKSLGGYAIESKIGAGGMGGVYLAEQTSLKRKVALKVLNEKFASDSAFVDQFVNEARAAGALNHPNVVQVYDVGSAEGNYFFSMEVMPGGSIEDRIREGKVEWQDGLNWFIDAANALIFAEKREILHRDVKPDNLMIAEDESAKLCDLGLAKKSEVKDLMDQGIIGTPHFISPEAIRRKPDVDGRTDLYSLGCSFFRVFTGKNPFPGKSVKEILLGHLNGPVPAINSINRNVPRELDEIVAKLMAKEPGDRFQTPTELLRALDKVRTAYNLEAHGIKPASRRPLIIGAAAAAIAIGVAVWFATRPDKVVVQEKTAEQIAQELKVKRDSVKQRLNGKVLNANGALVALNGRAVERGGVTKDNFKDAEWSTLLGEYRSAADDWDATIRSWAKESAEEKDDVILGFYRASSDKLAGLVADARSKATEYDKDIKELKQDEAKIDAATKKAREDLLAAVKKLAAEIQAHFENREFIACERKLRPNTFQDLSNRFLKLKYKKYPLLDWKKDIVPVLNDHIPGDAKGLNRGKKIVDDAVKAIESRTEAQITAAEGKVRGAGDPQIPDFDEAIAILEAYVKELPTITPEEAKAAPRTTAAYRRARSVKVRPALSALKRDRMLKIYERNTADKLKYFKLLKKLWSPPTAGGLLQRFDLQAAIDQAALVSDLMKTRGYKQLTLEWVATTKALKALFDHFHATFADGKWSSTSFYYEDAKGKRKKATIKSVGAEGIKWKGDVHSYTALGPALLLEEFFFVRDKDGEPAGPRFPCEPIDHFGLAVLYELAGDYKNAATQYKQAQLALSDDPLGAVILARMGRLGIEAEAAAKWIAARDWVDVHRAYVKTLEALRNAGKWDQDARTDLINKGDDLNKQLQNMQTMFYELKDTARLAGTTWGSSVREAPHPDVAYAGEELPPKAMRNQPVRDPGGGDNRPGNVGNGGGDEKKKPGGAGPEPGPNGKGDGGDDKGAPPKDDGENKKPPPKIRGK